MKRKRLNVQSVAMSLHLDWVTHKAAKFAVLNWHYSKRMPVNKLVKIGAWEDGKFIGAIIFGTGTSARGHLQYGIDRFQVCELVRVALKNHKYEVSKIIAQAIRILKKKCPKIVLITSFADPVLNHVGTIYQAGNWIYAGKSDETKEFFFKGKWRHVTDIYQRQSKETIKTLKTRKRPGKYKYLMALTKEMKKRIEIFREPYPKRMPLEDCQRPVDNGGANPTHTLQELSHLPPGMGV